MREVKRILLRERSAPLSPENPVVPTPATVEIFPIELAVRFDRAQREPKRLGLPARFEENFRQLAAAASLSF
jgi:hypothetical protein